MQDLSDDIILDVLSRLPVVSLRRFSTDDKHERLLLCGNYNWFSVEINSSQFGHQSLAARLNFAPDRNPTCCHEICCSCDGLVLMLDVGFHYFFVNPSTRESRELPKPPFSKAFDHYGLVYDSSIDDYKVVNSSSYDRETECADNVVSVYALKTDSWRRIGSSPYDHSRSEHRSGAFVCGALHWVASNGTNDVIVALDLADEKFRTLSSPTLGFTGDRLCVVGGCLCVFVEQFYNDRCGLDVWVMNEYGVRDSWRKFTVPFYDYSIACSSRPLSLSRTGQVLFDIGGYRLVIFDPREEEFKELVVHVRPILFEAGTYVESLVSPKRLCSVTSFV